jgi:prepilin-type processing-associated H-X9-DG protein
MLIEVFVVLLLLALAAAVLLPAMARTRCTSTPRTRCVNNLKQMGLSARMYANDHEEKFPWKVAATNGGTVHLVSSSDVFRHLLAMSNELSTPKILICPDDRSRFMTADFGTLSNENISYFAGLTARESVSDTLLFGDRHITGGTLANDHLRVITRKSDVAWLPGVHAGQGNVGMADGSVQQVPSASLQQIIRSNSLPVMRLALP